MAPAPGSWMPCAEAVQDGVRCTHNACNLLVCHLLAVPFSVPMIWFWRFHGNTWQDGAPSQGILRSHWPWPSSLVLPDTTLFSLSSFFRFQPTRLSISSKRHLGQLALRRTV